MKTKETRSRGTRSAQQIKDSQQRSIAYKETLREGKKVTRSDHQRCPRCKKIRMKWMRANMYDPSRKRWQHRPDGLVCFICIEREGFTGGDGI